MPYINIKPVHLDGLNCFEDPVFTFVAHYTKEYPLTFSEVFGFEYPTIDTELTGLLGDRIGTSKDSIMDLIEKYCGIGINVVVAKNEYEIFHAIREQLARGIPTPISVDYYWLPWMDAYQKRSVYHYCLATGIEESNDIICLDPYRDPEIHYLPYADFVNCFNRYVNFNIKQLTETIDYQQILAESVRRASDKYHFKKIKCFASDFTSQLNPDKEFENFNISAWEVPLIRNLEYITGERYLYSCFIKYIEEKTKNNSLLTVINELMLIRSKWETVRSILIKGYFKGYTEETTEKAFAKFMEIADMEEKVLLHLNDVVSGACNMNVKCEEMKEVTGKAALNYVHIDLRDYFNGVAFHSSISKDCLADFTGLGVYMLSENVPSGQVISVESMSFQFPYISDNTYDNILCKGQTIKVPVGSYKYITFLAAAEWGSYIENIKLNFSNSETSDTQINVSDFFMDPFFDECVAWSGKVKIVEKNRDRAFDTNINFFAVSHSINKQNTLESIILPYCPNIHIFAITLCS